MPLTDSYGQGIQYPTLTDKPNAQTLGQGIVDGLTPKVVMTYASAIVRGATIKKPTAGMLTWLKDVGRLEVYDGSGWAVVTAGTSTWKTIDLATSEYSHNGNSQGTFQYRLINLFGEMGLMFRGGIGVTYPYPNGSLPGNGRLNASALPVGARPSTLRTVVVPCSDTSSNRITLKMDITTDGILKLFGTQADSKPPWVGFNGVFCSL
ncbi:hypothetical protein [Streptomyces sp. NRRL S-31]|uniref:hypothetical protein n=1 Tax=Streptomyces sp. NRRL S-31 TaxID=1463898 RepID=UPI0007C87966|nr:hypothetical protein [Streptomyces sp. NRRL S-31]